MFGKVKLETAVRFTMMCTRLSACLAPSTSASSLEIILHKVYWWIALCISLSFSLPIMYDLYLNRDDVNNIMLNMAELCPICTTTVKLFLCKYNEQKLQACVAELEHFVATASRRERQLLQHYVDRCISVHYFMLFCIVSTIFGFSSVPIFLPQPYPTHATYPFKVETDLLKNMIRAFQILAIVQTALFVSIDAQFSTLIWFTGARFELLSEELRKVSDVAQIHACVRKHQNVLRFAEDVNLLTRFVVSGVGISTAIGTICGGIQLLQDVTAMVKARFVSFVMVGALELFTYAWPAEHLVKISEDVGYSAYSARWTGQKPEMTNLLFIVMQRARKPASISVSGFIPMLSLDFYKSFLSTSFSYFTTLRATTMANTS
ncbi:putative odorant receptor 92a isoform X1 [Neodiprion lecontei]|uniref:Odorant receptor n=1 Tax=Neodiprion lecontei TaxID=441921 RepID=A0A6J0CAV0_NEOLC|nr:putative odorant receptor 92a isoform X1 [Neodiprion lecontei]